MQILIPTRDLSANSSITSSWCVRIRQGRLIWHILKYLRNFPDQPIELNLVTVYLSLNSHWYIHSPVSQ